jgi:hypothetical protein
VEEVVVIVVTVVVTVEAVEAVLEVEVEKCSNHRSTVFVVCIPGRILAACN